MAQYPSNTTTTQTGDFEILIALLLILFLAPIVIVAIVVLLGYKKVDVVMEDSKKQDVQAVELVEQATEKQDKEFIVCNACGKQIPLDSVFCKECGARQVLQQNEIVYITGGETAQINNSRHKAKGWGIFFIVFCFLFLLIICCWNRPATIKDIEIESEINVMSLGLDFEIESYCNIRDLEITVLYYDYNSRLVKSQIFEIGDIKKGKTTRETITIVGFTMSEIKNIKSTKIEVSGGRVGLF